MPTTAQTAARHCFGEHQYNFWSLPYTWADCEAVSEGAFLGAFVLVGSAAYSPILPGVGNLSRTSGVLPQPVKSLT